MKQALFEPEKMTPAAATTAAEPRRHRHHFWRGESGRNADRDR